MRRRKDSTTSFVSPSLDKLAVRCSVFRLLAEYTFALRTLTDAKQFVSSASIYQKNNSFISMVVFLMFAEAEGFEPSVQFPGQHLSRMLL